MYNGFNDLEKHLNEMSKAAEDLNGENEIPFEELFTDNFISSNTNFPTMEAFTKASGLDFSNQEAFEAIDENILDTFVSSNSIFDSWADMLGKASDSWIAKKLGL
ncbi:MAG: hypothetical protein ACTIDE_03390 [Carnobacterium maltaromaticum]